MKQRCNTASILVQYVALAVVAIVLTVRGQLGVAIVVLGLAAISIWAYVQVFPRISRYLGYGSVADRTGPLPVASSAFVTLYTLVGCPFCPIVRHRLQELQRHLGFELREIDVTLRPGLLIEKGIRAVPVVEVGDRRLVGHATTEQLAALIGGRPVAVAA